jgi:hypothetical protein
MMSTQRISAGNSSGALYGLIGFACFWAVMAFAYEEQDLDLLAQEQIACLVCHSEIKGDYGESSHAGFAVTCVDCHGGDPTKLESVSAAHAPEAGYRGKPGRTEIPQLCASCHADPVKMKPYGLRTDQYTEYQSSMHGKLLASGDTNAAVCTDCHTSHRILPASEPRSTVHPENIPATCAHCHSDQTRMRSYGLPTDQLENYQEGAHGIALLKLGNTKSPNCATCHGIHGATPPGVEDVSKVCGTCHINERVYFNGSPHKKPMDEKKLAECTSCHNNHQIETADTGKLFDTTCTRCHAAGSKEFIVGQKLKTLLQEGQTALQEAEHVLDQARQMAFDVSIYRSRMLTARSYLIQALPVQHTLDVAKVNELTREARTIANDVRAETHNLQSAIRIRWFGLSLIIGYVLLTMVVIYLYRRERQRAHLEKTPP